MSKNEIDFLYILENVRVHKRLIVWCINIFFVFGLAYAIFRTPEYKATVIIQPVEEDVSGAASLASKFGGLASLAGINIRGGGNKEEYLGILRSRRLAEQFIRKYHVMPDLFQDLWDAEKKQWLIEAPLTLKISDTIHSILAGLSGDRGFKRRQGAQPTMGEGIKKFEEEVRDILEYPREGLYGLAIRHEDPRLAAQWANGYIALANEEIRMRAIREAQTAIEFLEKEADKTKDIQLKGVIFDLIQGQLQRIATARARQEYAFRIIDPAHVPEEPAGLTRPVIIVVSILLGILFAAAIIFLRTVYYTTNRIRE